MSWWSNYYDGKRLLKVMPRSFPSWCPLCANARENGNFADSQWDYNLDGVADCKSEGGKDYIKLNGSWREIRPLKTDPKSGVQLVFGERYVWLGDRWELR